MNKLNRQYELIQLYESFVGQNHKYYVVFWSAYFKMVLKSFEENKFYQGDGKATLWGATKWAWSLQSVHCLWIYKMSS